MGSKTKKAIKHAAEKNNLQKYSLDFVGDSDYLEKYFLRKVKEFNKKCSSNNSSNVVTNRMYLRHEANYRAGKKSGSLGKVYAFEVVGECVDRKINQIWYSWRRMDDRMSPPSFWYYISTRDGTDDLTIPPKEFLRNGGSENLLGNGPMKFKRTAIHWFEAEGQGCQIKGKLIR